MSEYAPGYANPELLGYTTGNQADRWTAAKNAAKAVMDMGIYSLYKATPAQVTPLRRILWISSPPKE